MIKMQNVTVIGKTGQLAKALIHEAKLSGIEIMSIGREQCDLSLPAEHIETVIDSLPQTEAIIIAAAYTAVDAAEAERTLAMAVNAEAPGIIGQAAARRKLPVVHISTDYVFNGQATTPYAPEHSCDPVNFYGMSKAQGEANLMKAQPLSSILRTSWVYDAEGKNFLTTMLRLANTRREISVVSDQFGRPTYSRDLAKAALIAADALSQRHASAKGVFHVSNSGEAISWADFARAIFEIFSEEIGHTVNVASIPTTSYPTAAKRPLYSVMDISDFEATFKLNLPHWRGALLRAKSDMGQG